MVRCMLVRAKHFAGRTYRRETRKLAQRICHTQRTLSRDSGMVALTFDDGPDPRFTELTLDVLRRFSVKATFFMVGARARSRPDLVRQVLAEGHSIGSHSDTHPEIVTLRARAVLREYREGRDTLSRIAGRPVLLCRPPKGRIDLTGGCALRTLGMTPWLWTLSGEDWTPGITAAGIRDAIGSPAAGDVILLHDGLEQPVDPSARDRSEMIRALEQLIPEVLDRGLRFTTLA